MSALVRSGTTLKDRHRKAVHLLKTTPEDGLELLALVVWPDGPPSFDVIERAVEAASVVFGDEGQRRLVPGRDRAAELAGREALEQDADPRRLVLEEIA